MYINISSLTTFVLLGASVVNAVPDPRRVPKFKRPTMMAVADSEDPLSATTTYKHEILETKMDNLVLGAGMSRLEKVFHGLEDSPQTQYIKLSPRAEATDSTEHSPIYNTLFASIKETLTEASKDSSSNDDITAEDIEPLREAAVNFASILEEAASGSAPADIVARNAEFGQLEIIPISAITNMVHEFGKIATETAKTVALVVEEIRHIAADAKAHERERQRFAHPSEPTNNEPEAVDETSEDTKALEQELPTLETSLSETHENKTLAARFILPGLDPLTITIHIMGGLMAEAGYNYYKSKKAPQPDYAKAAFKAQGDRLALVEKKLKSEIAMNAAIKKAHAAHAKRPVHNHN